MKNVLSTVLRWLTAAVLAAGILPAAAQEPKYGGTLRVGLADDAKSLDPTFQVNFSERQPLYLIYNTIFKLGSDLSIQPELATDWAFSEDRLSLTIHLREGVKFHDGTPLDAAAVKWNLDHRMDPAANSPSASALTSVVKAVTAADSKTVVIELKSPAPALLGMLAQREGFIISPTAAQAAGEQFGLNPVGSGPFKFKEWALGRIVLEKNPDYWEEGKPYLDSVVFSLVPDATTALPRLLTRELDAIDQLSSFDIRALERDESLVFVPSPGARWISLHMITTSPPFDDVRVRQAIAYGLDRNKIVEIVTGGSGKIANGPTPPSLWWYNPDLTAYPYDPERAKQLLAEAGHADGLSITLALPPVASYRPLSQLVQEQLKLVGIDVTIRPVSRSEWAELLMTGKINFIPILWTQRPDPDGLLSLLLQSNSSQNWTRYSNPEFDALLASGREEGDMEKRKAIYWKAEELLARDLPYLNLYFPVAYEGLQSYVRNFEWVPDEIPRYRDIWIDK